MNRQMKARIGLPSYCFGEQDQSKGGGWGALERLNNQQEVGEGRGIG